MPGIGYFFDARLRAHGVWRGRLESCGNAGERDWHSHEKQERDVRQNGGGDVVVFIATVNFSLAFGATEKAHT